MKTLKIWIRDILLLLACSQILFHVLIAMHPHKGSLKQFQESVYGGPELLNQATFAALGAVLGFLAYFGQKASARVHRAAIESQAIRFRGNKAKQARIRATYRKMVHDQGHLEKC